VVKLLLETGKVDVDSKDKCEQTPLSWAAIEGHEAVVKLLLKTGKIDFDSKDGQYRLTPLLWAANRGHETVVKLLRSHVSIST
jgi:ankyrin repeat protein